MEVTYSNIRSHFKKVSRPFREQILCAMIRVNYGTPWAGDADILKNFMGTRFENKFVAGGLTSLIEVLSPFTDEPTESGIHPPKIPVEDRTVQDAELTRTFGRSAVTLASEQTTRLTDDAFEKTVKVV
jgi:hypothetical protein